MIQKLESGIKQDETLLDKIDETEDKLDDVVESKGDSLDEVTRDKIDDVEEKLDDDSALLESVEKTEIQEETKIESTENELKAEVANGASQKTIEKTEEKLDSEVKEAKKTEESKGE